MKRRMPRPGCLEVVPNGFIKTCDYIIDDRLFDLIDPIQLNQFKRAKYAHVSSDNLVTSEFKEGEPYGYVDNRHIKFTLNEFWPKNMLAMMVEFDAELTNKVMVSTSSMEPTDVIMAQPESPSLWSTISVTSLQQQQQPQQQQQQQQQLPKTPATLATDKEEDMLDQILKEIMGEETVKEPTVEKQTATVAPIRLYRHSKDLSIAKKTLPPIYEDISDDESPVEKGEDIIEYPLRNQVN